MKFIVDAQLPRRLSLFLRSAGHDAIHTLDLPAGNATDDAEIARRADQEGHVVVTKDSDFVSDHLLKGSPARLLLVSTGNISNGELLALFAGGLAQIVTALAESRFIELQADQLLIHLSDG